MPGIIEPSPHRGVNRRSPPAAATARPVRRSGRAGRGRAAAETPRRNRHGLRAGSRRFDMIVRLLDRHWATAEETDRRARRAVRLMVATAMVVAASTWAIASSAALLLDALAAWTRTAITPFSAITILVLVTAAALCRLRSAAVDHAKGQSGGVDVVVVTALEEEQQAFIAALGEVNIHDSAGRTAYLRDIGGLRTAVVSLLGMGNVGAAATAYEALRDWQPKHLVLVGIAAGVPGSGNDLQLGDVVVADQVVGFEQAKITRVGPQRRYDSYRPIFHLLAAAKSVRPDEWTDAIATPRPAGSVNSRAVPRAHIGTILSGEKTFADRNSIQDLRRVWPRAVGADMEGFGVALAAYRAGRGFLAVKGVSDYGDVDKDDRWHAYAAEAASRFALAVLRRHAADVRRT